MIIQIATLLNEIRIEKNISKYRLSQITKLNQSSIKRIFDFSSTDIKMSTFLKILKALEVNPEQFFNRLNKK